MPRSLTSHVDHPKKVARRLREARLAAGLSQRALAAGLCTSAYISRVEAGARVPSLQLLVALAGRLGLTADYLATGLESQVEFEAALLDAELAMRLDELDEAQRLYDEHLSESGGASKAALAGLGQIALRRGETLRATELLEESLANESLLAHPEITEALGRAYAASGAFEAATVTLERAYHEAKAANARLEGIRFGVVLANALTDSGQFQRAQTVLQEVLEELEPSSDPTTAARIYWTQSRLHVLSGHPRLGARYARRAIAILERMEDDSYTAMAYHLLAYAEVELGAAEAALAHLRHGRKLFGPRFGDHDTAKFAVEEARALLALKRLKPAANAASRALEVIDALEPGDRGRAYVVLGEVFAQSRDNERAEEMWRLALGYLLDTGKPYVMEAASRLSALLESRGEDREALKILKKALALSRDAGVPTAARPTA